MERFITSIVKKDRMIKTLLAIFALLGAWWIYLSVGDGSVVSEHNKLLWAASYQVIALLGGVWGIALSRGWGGSQSVMGRSIIAFSVGLLLQVFGQSIFSFYNLFLEVDIPYPSIADFGFFGSIAFYIYGILLLAKASGVKLTIESFGKKTQAIIIPIVMFGLSYYFFLRGYESDGSGSLKLFLDFGYPIGQVIYIAIAVLTYVLSKKVLGGIMKEKVLFILFALVAQYIADSNFLYQAINLTWVNGGYGDLLYMIAYTLMAISLIKIGVTYKKVKEL